MASFPQDEQEDLAARLTQAVESLDGPQVRALLARGVQADAWRISFDGDLPLQKAARCDGPEALAIANLLIEAGADIDHQGDFGCTALTRAVEAAASNRNDWAMARCLIAGGADPSIPNDEGLTPAECAISEGHSDAVLAMLEAGMDPNAGGLAGPLLWYCAWDDPVVVKALLERGVAADSGSKPVGGKSQTPLQRAAEAYANGVDDDTFMEIAVALIQGGADPSRLEAEPECLQAFLLARREEHFLARCTPADLASSPRPGHRRPL